MKVASTSVALNPSEVSGEVGAKLLKRSVDTEAQQVSKLLQNMQPPPEEKAQEEGKGSRLNVYA